MEKAIFEFMFSTGCRIGEVVSLYIKIVLIGQTDRQLSAGKEIFNIRCEIWLKRYLDNRKDKDPSIYIRRAGEKVGSLTFLTDWIITQSS